MTTVPPKPNDPTIAEVTWAEGPKSAIEGSEDPRKPDQLSSGYGNQERLPHAEFNWLFRSVMRWISWLVSKVDFHVHDGGMTDASVPKVKASQHLDWGTNGSVSVSTDTGALHEITHGPTSGGATTKRIITGQLRAATIQSPGTGTLDAVSIRNANNTSGLLDAPTIRINKILRNAAGGTINVRDQNDANNVTLNVKTLQTDIIKRSATSGAINVRNQDDGNVTMNVNGVQTNAILATTSGANATVTFYDSSGNTNGKISVPTISTSRIESTDALVVENRGINTRNSPIAAARIKTTDNSFESNIGIGSAGGFSSSSWSASNVCTLTLDLSLPTSNIFTNIYLVTPTVDTTVDAVPLIPVVATVITSTTTSAIQVRLYNLSGVLVKAEFSIVVYRKPLN
jgi:hypothetical protein